ncbi:MAG: DUF4339 domain-containing protein [Verrucomicrobiota bacterium]
MEQDENLQTWFIMHDGERFGPYSIEQLKEGVEFHEINPRLDLAWKEGMADWIPAGEVEGLFVKNSNAESAEKKDHKNQKDNTKKKEERETKSAFSESEYVEEPSNYPEEQEWEGVSRGGFFFFCYIFPVLWMVGLSYGGKMLTGVIPDDILPIVMACLASLPFFIVIFAILKRFQNLAMSRFWFFGLFTPLVIWLYYRLFACPPGYAVHKRLGGLGWFLAIIYWLPWVGVLALGAMVAIQGPDKYKDVIEKNRSQYEELMIKAKDLTKTPETAEEKKANEKAEKGPSIIPMRK